MCAASRSFARRRTVIGASCVLRWIIWCSRPVCWTRKSNQNSTRRLTGVLSLPLIDSRRGGSGQFSVVLSFSLIFNEIMTSQMNSAAPEGRRRKRRGRSVILRILTILIGLVTGLSVTEGGLRIVEKVQLGDRARAATVDDPQLGMRVVPYATGHDANGFRNASVPPKVDIVALGDSQTWGVNVHKDDAWPQQLEKLSGHSVYNMGVGGYGPIQ